jgi:L-rhamnose-H+ transport protein
LGSDPNLIFGVICHWIGGLASATNFIPFRGIKQWSWEVYWIVQGFTAWIVAPLLFGLIFVPSLFPILCNAPTRSLSYAAFWGAMWGIGGITFGLAIRYLGIALGYAIALGFCTVFGTLMPPIFDGDFMTIAHQRSGQIILAGLGICLIAIGVNGIAGYLKESEVTLENRKKAGERDFSFGKGIAVSIFAGIMSSCFAYGLASGKPIAMIAKAHLLAIHRSGLWQNLPVLIVVLWGGFATNLAWSAILIFRNRSGVQFLGATGVNPLGSTQDFNDTTNSKKRLTTRSLLGNYFLSGSAGILWYLQFFFYSMGQANMGRFDFSSWTLHMASIIIFATLWGIGLREWRGTSRRTQVLVSFGLFLLIASTVVVGYGNYMKAISSE